MNTIDKQSQDKKAKKYNKIKRRISVITLTLEILLLLIILFSGISTELRDMVGNVSNSPWIIVALYTISLGLAAEVISLPLDFYSSYTLEHKFQLSNQSLWNWILDLFKGMGISLVLGLLLVEILYWVLRSFPQSWWIIAGIIFSLIFIILAKLAPVILMPIFFKFKLVTDDELKNRLAALVKKVGTDVNGVFEMDLSKKSKTANAGLTGWGNTRRIILADTLLNNYNYDEIEVILAHELKKRGLRVKRQVPVPIVFDEIKFDEGFRADLIVEEKVIVELINMFDIFTPPAIFSLHLTRTVTGENAQVRYGGQNGKKSTHGLQELVQIIAPLFILISQYHQPFG